MIEKEDGGEVDPMITEAAEDFDAQQTALRSGETVRARAENPILDRCNELGEEFYRMRGINDEIIARSAQLQNTERTILHSHTELVRKAAELSHQETEIRNLERASRLQPGSADYDRVPQMKEQIVEIQDQIEAAREEIEDELEVVRKQIAEFQTAITIEAGKKKG